MEDKKENHEIYGKMPHQKKLENFIGLIPLTVSVRDDVARNRFTITEYKGNKEITLNKGLKNSFRHGKQGDQ